MQQVRYTLTNILMKVTNEEMQKIAEEVYADFRTKGTIGLGLTCSLIHYKIQLKSMIWKCNLGLILKELIDSIVWKVTCDILGYKSLILSTLLCKYYIL